MQEMHKPVWKLTFETYKGKANKVYDENAGMDRRMGSRIV